MGWDIENTAGKDEARQALEESRRSSLRSSKIVAEARRQSSGIRDVRIENHFTLRLAEMFRGE